MPASVIDFFCSCGGTSDGLRKAGMNILAGIDIDSVALKTFKRNFSEAAVIDKDIRDLHVDEIKNLISTVDGPIVFSACAPCQPFSMQNKNRSKVDDRKSLLTELHRFITECEPDYILLENVPGMQSVKEGPFTKFLEFLESSGYEFDFDIKDAKKYGVPQTRRRLVLVASKHSAISLPEETHGEAENLLDYKTVWETIGGYHPLKAGQKSKKIPNHQVANLTDLSLTRMKHTPEGGDRRNWPESLVLECHKNYSGHTDVYGRLWRDKHAVTLTTKCYSISNGRYGHPTQNRALSVRESAALQTFDDDFIFEGTLSQTAKQVGNAVPVEFARVIGDSVMAHYNLVVLNG